MSENWLAIEFDQLLRSMNIHSLGHLIHVLRDSRMTVPKRFDEIEDVEGLEEEEFSGQVWWNEINYRNARNKFAPLLCNQAQMPRPYWVPGFEVNAFSCNFVCALTDFVVLR